jgi:hypothetical protein
MRHWLLAILAVAILPSFPNSPLAQEGLGDQARRFLSAWNDVVRADPLWRTVSEVEPSLMTQLRTMVLVAGRDERVQDFDDKLIQERVEQTSLALGENYQGPLTEKYLAHANDEAVLLYYSSRNALIDYVWAADPPLCSALLGDESKLREYVRFVFEHRRDDAEFRAIHDALRLSVSNVVATGKGQPERVLATKADFAAYDELLFSEEPELAAVLQAADAAGQLESRGTAMCEAARSMFGHILRQPQTVSVPLLRSMGKRP